MRPCVALRMWAMTLSLRIGKRRTMAATGEARALCASTKTRTPLPSKKAMPKPSLCSSARVEKPVKLNTMSVGVFAFMPRSWHIARLFREEPEHPLHRQQMARVARLVEHAAHAAQQPIALLRAPDEQVGEPGVAVDPVRLGVQVEARLQRVQAGFVARAHVVLVARDVSAVDDRLGRKDAGLHRLADALAAEGVRAARSFAGDDEAGSRIRRAFQRAAQRRALQRADPFAAVDELARRRVDAREVVEHVA